MIYLLANDCRYEYLKKEYTTDKIVILGHSWGSLLGNLYAIKHQGQLISTMENERIMYEMMRNNVKDAGNEKEMMKLTGIGQYPTDDIDEVLRKLPIIHKITIKYSNNKGSSMLMKMMEGSPCFKLSDYLEILKSSKANKKLIADIFRYDLNKCGKKYEVLMYYILGEEDNTTPVKLVRKYFEGIEAKKKFLTVIPNAGHNVMYEQPNLYAKELAKIKSELY